MARRSATSLISKSIPNLLGGISQQPDSLRYDNQCGLQDNGLPSVLDGLIKRPPTEHISQIVGNQSDPVVAVAAPEDYFTHIINLNSSDQYALLIKADSAATSSTNNTIILKKLSDGSDVVVHESEALRDYLKMASATNKAEKDLRAITIADYTFLVNRSKTVSFTSDTNTSRKPEALLYTKTGDYGTLYTAEIDTKKYRPSVRDLVGTANYFESASNASLQTGNIDFAFSMWVYRDTDTNNQDFVNKFTGVDATSEYKLGVTSSNKVYLSVYDDTSGDETILSTASVPTSQWSHIIVEHIINEGGGANIVFTINGSSETVPTSNTTGPTISPETGADFRIGQLLDGGGAVSGYDTDAKISLMGFWKRTFTEAERAALYNSGTGLVYVEMDDSIRGGLISFWAFEEASGNALDSHGTNTLTEEGTIPVQAAGLRGEGHVYKTEVLAPAGTQVKTFGDKGHQNGGTYDSRDAIDTTNIAKAFTDGEAVGFNNHLPFLALDERGGPAGGQITEYLDGVPITPAKGELFYVAGKEQNGTINQVAFDEGSGKITNSGSGSYNFSQHNYAGGEVIYVTGSKESANNGFHTTETLQAGGNVINTTTDGMVDTSEEHTVRIYLMDTISEPITLNTTHGIRNAGNMTIQREGAVIHVQSSDTIDFGLNVTDGISGSALVLAKQEKDKLSELPTIAPHDFQIKILGSADSTVDDYYVKFKADDGDFGTGSYEETRAANIEYKLDSSTMPHALVKLANGSFRFTAFDGTALTTEGTEHVAPIWNERNVGDLDTNPNPTFIGKTLNDIFHFRNRLGVLSDENVILSETNEFFNFFRTTTLDLLNSTPIDVASTHNRVSVLTSALSFSRQLILFSDSTQFVLSSGQGALSPETVSITKTTSFDSVTDLKPISLGSSIYFGYSRGSFSGLRQYLRSNDTETVFDAEDISSQIPQYIEGSLRNMSGSTHEDVILLTTDSNRNIIYCYKFYDTPGQGRIQSSWSRFTFPSSCSVIGIEFIGSTLYIAICRTDGVYLEKMRLEPGLVDTGMKYRTLLDRRILNTETYNPGPTTEITFSADGKTLTLPYEKQGTPLEVVTFEGDRVEVLTQADGSNQITVSEDLSDTDIYVGEAYSLTYEFSDVVLRETTLNNETALISQGRKQIRYLSLNYHNTAYFRVTVTPDIGDRDTSTYPFTGRILGEANLIIGDIPLDSGIFKVPVYSKADQVTISIINDSPLPCAITGAEFEMLFHARSRRYS